MTQRGLLIMRISVLSLGVALAVAGVWRGELGEIMKKAIVVCLECIGIG